MKRGPSAEKNGFSIPAQDIRSLIDSAGQLFYSAIYSKKTLIRGFKRGGQGEKGKVMIKPMEFPSRNDPEVGGGVDTAKIRVCPDIRRFPRRQAESGIILGEPDIRSGADAGGGRFKTKIGIERIYHLGIGFYRAG